VAQVYDPDRIIATRSIDEFVNEGSASKPNFLTANLVIAEREAGAAACPNVY